MQITVDLHDDIARHADPGREALERLAIEARPGRLKSRLAAKIGRPTYWNSCGANSAR